MALTRLAGPRSRAFALTVSVAWLAVTGLPLAPAKPSFDPVAMTTVALTGAVDHAVTPLGAAAVAAVQQGDPAAAPGWSAHVQLTKAAEMVGFDWADQSAGELRVRSHGPSGWSDWVDVDGPDGTPDPGEGNGRGSAGPVWIGHGDDAIELDVAGGTLRDLQLRLLHIPDPPTQSGLGIESAGAAPAWANIWPRSAWGARDWSSSTPGCGSGPKYGSVRGAVVHHTVTTNSYSPDEALSLLRGIQAFHIDANGWCDIGYNFVVDRYGRAFEGRAGGMDRAVIGAQVAGFNSVTTGIALLGQYQPGASPPAADVPPAQLDALRSVLVWKLATHGVDALGTVTAVSGCEDENGGICKYPAGSVATFPAISPHRELNYTSCPGDYTVAYLGALRTQVAAQVFNSGPWSPLPNWTPTANAPRVLTVDAVGGVHPAGGATAVNTSGYWPYFAIVRGAAGDGSGGYVLDGYGGVHGYGSAPSNPGGSAAYWPGWDIARGIATGPVQASGYVVDGYGGVHPFGAAPPTSGTAYWPGRDIVRGIASQPGGLGGYVLDAYGGLHPFGLAPPSPGGAAYWPGWDIARGVAMNPTGPGGYVLDGFGGVHAFGGAPDLAISRYTPGWDVFRGLVILPGGGGYAIDAFGVPWPIGSAPAVATSLSWTGFDLARGIVAG